MASTYSTLEIERSGAVATIWMNRPEVFNAFNEQLIADLGKACAELDGDEHVRVVILAGRGRHFSAGADLNWMQRASTYGEAENLADARAFAGMLRTLSGLSKPTIARVQGAALGGGTGLAAACDMAVASEDALFSTSEVKFGIIPAVISPYVLRAQCRLNIGICVVAGLVQVEVAANRAVPVDEILHIAAGSQAG